MNSKENYFDIFVHTVRNNIRNHRTTLLRFILRCSSLHHVLLNAASAKQLLQSVREVEKGHEKVERSRNDIRRQGAVVCASTS